MNALPLVFPVAVDDARAWAVGSFNDLHLVLRAPLLPGAVFFGDLPDLASYKFALRQCVYWRQRGAVGMIWRTSNPVVRDHMARFGARPTCQDADGRIRYLLPAVGFAKWLGKFQLPPLRAVAPPANEPVSPHVRVAGA